MSSSRPTHDEDAESTVIASESTPLISRNGSVNNYGAQASLDQRLSFHETGSQTLIKSRRRWASIAALALLSVLAVLIMLLGFFVPETLQEYAIQATSVTLQGVVPEFTGDGVRVRVRGTFSLQSSKVKNPHVRNLGVFGTWVARQVSTGESELRVTLPEYDNVLLGIAKLPPLKVSIVDGRETLLDFTSDLTPPTSIDGIKKPLDMWMKGKLDHLQVAGSAQVALRSGIIRLPTTTISQLITVENSKIPAMPKFNVTKLNFHDRNSTDAPEGMQVDASIVVQNDFPIDVSLPSLGFKLMVANCLPQEPKIVLAEAIVDPSNIRSRQDVLVSATGYVQKPSDDLIDKCPDSGKSPLDTLLGGYIRGHTITIYVRGSDIQPEGTPIWLSDVLSGLVVPFPFTGHSLGNVIKNFTMEDVAFNLPQPGAGTDSPQVSANIKAVITLPEEMNFSVNVTRVRATSDVYYKKKKVGEINLKKWQPASSKRLETGSNEPPMLLVESKIDKAPLTITDDDAFTDVLQQLLFGKQVLLKIKALVDVEIDTALGILTVQEIPATGDVPVKPILGHGPGGIADTLKPVIQNLEIVSTTPDSLLIRAIVDVNNPSNYSATIPFANVHILVNNTLLGHATVRNLAVIPGLNKNLTAEAEWSPMGEDAKGVGSELLSQYISGWNVSLTIQTHRDTLPALPSLGEALSKINITIPVPHLKTPDDDKDPDDDDDPDDATRPRFIRGATMHLFSSTATFLLSSPLTRTSIFLTSLNATAFYKDDEVGTIIIPEVPPDDPAYQEMEIPPGDSETERLPVNWDLGSVGYDALRKALGGTLKLRAEAVAGVRVGEWREKVWIIGSGIGAGVRL